MLEAAQALDTCDLFITIGTSSVVYPAAGFAAQVLLTWLCLLSVWCLLSTQAIQCRVCGCCSLAGLPTTPAAVLHICLHTCLM